MGIVDSNKLLTIAIPTYNREKYLKECLDHICCQLDDKIELVVRDNKSTNYDFWRFIKPYEEKYGVVAFQNDCNIGGDANFARIFETCTTKWLLILGDDDYLAPNAINDIVAILKDNPDVLFVNFQSPYEGKITGLKGFARAMAGMSSFANSFFISVGVHNLDLGRSDIFYTYQYLSMKISQIIRVMMHLRTDPNTTCYFSNKEILEVHGEDVSWKHDELIIPFLTMYDIFRNERKILRNNVFRCIAGKLMHYISFSDYSFKDKAYFWHLLFIKYGAFNVLRYNSRHIIGVFYRKFL